MDELTKRTWAEISLKAIEHNYREMRSKLPAGCRFLALIKANAYGHGALPVAAMLEKAGCDYFAVACVDEAEELRSAGIRTPILILGYSPREYVARLAGESVTQAVSSLETARAYSDALSGTGLTLKIHIKLETGMGRTGFDVKRGDVSEVLELLKLPNLEVEGIFTHFAVSDEPSKEEYTRAQLSAFTSAVERIEAESGHTFKIKHCTNSGAMINYPRTYMDMVRPGVALYGMYPADERGDVELIPAMQLKSRVYAITEHPAGDCISYGCTYTAPRDVRLAVIPIGYADGLHRVLSNKAEFLLHGKRVRQVGRICMDMCMVDVTDLDGVNVGDTVTIFGKDGDAVLPVEELAKKADTINYEIVCDVSPRVSRVYVD